MIQLTKESASAACDGLVSKTDKGSGPGKVRILDGKRSVLCEIVLSSRAFQPAIEGKAVAVGLPKSGLGTTYADSGKDAVHFEVTDSENNVVWSGDIPQDMSLSNTTIAKNQRISVERLSFTQRMK